VSVRQRIDCPDCEGKGSAVVNESGWLKCYRCEVNRLLNAPDYSGKELRIWDPVSRFRHQINQAVWNVSHKWGYWFPREDARACAQDLVIGYASDERGPNDMGSLDDWEDEVNGDQDQLSCYVLRALNGDLFNAARDAKAAKEREKAAEISFVTGLPKRTALRVVKDEYVKNSPWWEQLERYGKGIADTEPSAEDVALAKMSLDEMREKYPIHYCRYVSGLTVGEIAREYGASVSSVREWLRREREKVGGDERIAA
jgi:DNA-binding transcriptional regulator YiaG